MPNKIKESIAIPNIMFELKATKTLSYEMHISK